MFLISKYIFLTLNTLIYSSIFSQFPFDGSQVRILVYRECDTRGRRLLFDSNALEKVYLKEKNDKNSNNVTLKYNVKSPFSSISGQQQQQQQQNSNNLTNLNNNHKESLLSDRLQASTNKGHSNGGFIEVCNEYGYKVLFTCSNYIIYTDITFPYFFLHLIAQSSEYQRHFGNW